MAHFLGSVKGARGETTRLGGKASGMLARAQGWNVGAEVFTGHAEQLGIDFADVTATSGSNGRQRSVYIGQVGTGEDGAITFRPSLDLCRSLGIKYGKVGTL